MVQGIVTVLLGGHEYEEMKYHVTVLTSSSTFRPH